MAYTYPHPRMDAKIQKFEYNPQGHLLYSADHLDHKTTDSDPNWEIMQYTNDATGNPTIIKGPLLGAWEDRETLDW